MNVRSRQEEAGFYALEQKALRAKRDTPAWAKLASWLYETTSDYGHSALLPFVWFVAINLAAFVVYTLISAIDQYPAGYRDLEIGTFTVRQIVSPFHTWTGTCGFSSRGGPGRLRPGVSPRSREPEGASYAADLASGRVVGSREHQSAVGALSPSRGWVSAPVLPCLAKVVIPILDTDL